MRVPLLIPIFCLLGSIALANDAAWPKPTAENKPWTRWWWLGSTVDKENITDELENFKAASIGGVEICPIYGVKGREEDYIDFLSPKWMELLAHTTSEAKRLGLKVDMTTGTGWPFGGPHVSDDIASEGVELNRHTLSGGERLESLRPAPRNERERNRPRPLGGVRHLLAVSDSGERLDLTERVDDETLDWTAPDGEWTLYCVSVREAVQRVKRPAPGGDGNVLDPYSTAAIDAYLGRFDEAFKGFDAPMPRSQFHDSFEYYGATWTDDLFAKFQRLRGYDLRDELPALFGDGDADRVARVKADYRETISDLHLAYARRWTEWSHGHGGLTRNQAHGAPANLLDLYASVDIPETETFGSLDEANIPMQKFASSAANLSGRPLTSAESFTWLNEHFNTALAEAKRIADYLFIAGINHLFFHGIPYSPKEAPWPGWQFYASVNFGPEGGLWHHLPFFNGYLTRVQSVLQSGRASNDVLLYAPFHDLWHREDEFLMTFTIHNVNRYLAPHPSFQLAERLWENGYGFDHLSDAYLQQVQVENGKASLGGIRYAAILVPRIDIMSDASAAKLAELSQAGVNVVFEDQLPSDVPGLVNLESRRASIRRSLESLRSTARVTTLDESTFAESIGVAGERFAKLGLRFIRREREGGFHYFITNRGEETVNGWVPLRGRPKSVVIMDPYGGQKAGQADIRNADSGSEIRLQLGPGESTVLRTFEIREADAPKWVYTEPAGDPIEITGNWSVEFIEGGPELPAPFTIDTLGSWTDRDDAEAKRFAGNARYSIRFDKPDGSADAWKLDLGEVAESARVRLNGTHFGVLWFPPFTIDINEPLKDQDNLLEIEVTNLAANRVRDLDIRGVEWKRFHDINVVGKDYRPLDASQWPLRDSGLLGPVMLIPLETEN